MKCQFLTDRYRIFLNCSCEKPSKYLLKDKSVVNIISIVSSRGKMRLSPLSLTSQPRVTNKRWRLWLSCLHFAKMLVSCFLPAFAGKRKTTETICWPFFQIWDIFRGRVSRLKGIPILRSYWSYMPRMILECLLGWRKRQTSMCDTTFRMSCSKWRHCPFYLKL